MTETDFANRLSSFMSVYLPHDRNVSKHTLASYKVAFIDFIIFMEKQKSVSVNRIMLKHVNRENILDYLRWIEVEKKYQSCYTQLSAGSGEVFLSVFNV